MVPPTAMAERPKQETKKTELSDRLTAAHPAEEILRATAAIYTVKGDDLIKKYGVQIGDCLTHMERCRPCTDLHNNYTNDIKKNGYRR
jgi:hypothetical protein